MLAVHAHVPWRRGTVAEAAPRLQPGGARGWAARTRQERACAPGTCVPGMCKSVLCLFPRAIHAPGVHLSRTVCAHTRSHICTPNTAPRTHITHTHTPSGTHTPSHTHALLRANTSSWTHTPSRVQTRSCTLPRVHLAGSGLGGGLTLLFVGRKTPPRTTGHCRTTPHAHSSCYQHPIQKTAN